MTKQTDTTTDTTEFFSNPNARARGRGRDGLQKIGDVFPQTQIRIAPAAEQDIDAAAIADGKAIARRPYSGLFVTELGAGSMGEELASRAVPLGSLLREVQGASDLRLARACARRLVAKIKANGGQINEDTERDAVGAGVVALAKWRTGEGDEPRAARVCWRGVEREVSGDILGDSIELSGVSAEWLMDIQKVEPLAVACVGGYETRDERARRYLTERGAARRASKVFPILERFAAGAGQRRRELADRIGRACLLLIGGESLDAAALAVGFHASGRSSAGDRLARAARAVMPGVHFDLRAPVKAKPEQARLNQQFEFNADGVALCVDFDNGRRYAPGFGEYVAPVSSREPLTPSANLVALDKERAAEREAARLAAMA